MSVLGTRSGVLATAQAATGASANTVDVGVDTESLHVLGVSAGGNKTWTIEQSLDGGTTWAPVWEPAATAGVLTIANLSAAVQLANPVGQYRTNVTAFTAGTFDATYTRGIR